MGERRSSRIGERRFDQYGEFRLMAIAEGYVMARRKGAVAFVIPEKEWNVLARTADLATPSAPRLVYSRANI
jgi:hypothetical protein